MKKITSTLVAVLFATLSLTSCSTDKTSEDYGTSTGNYYPMAVDNQWTMKQDTTAAATTKMIGTDSFSGTTYYQLSGGTDTGSIAGLDGLDMKIWVAKKGATYLTRIGDINISQSGVTIKMKGVETTILKDNLPVGGSWSGTAPMDMTVSDGTETETMKMSSKFTCTILEKNVAATVNGVAYSDVIKVNTKQELTIQDPTTGEQQTVVTNEEDWYANGVGPIKSITTANGKSAETFLVDYVVKK